MNEVGIKYKRSSSNDLVPVVDLFAGPGGLSEGFSSLTVNNEAFFRIGLSIEKEKNAHSTLELRSFFRQFSPNERPDDYYRFLKQEISIDELYTRYPSQYKKASSEAKLAALGKNTNEDIIDQWIHDSLQGKEHEWVLIGGPPCQAYSIAGRSRNKGISGYNPEEDDKHYLYENYLGIIARHWPSIFVMENVKGILSSKVGGNRIFAKILNDLRDPGKANGTDRKFKYNIYSLVISGALENGHDNKYIIKSEEYGIPQARHRVILLGVRDSIEFEQLIPDSLNPIKDRTTTWDVISDLPRIRSGLSRAKGSMSWIKAMNQIKSSQWINCITDEERDMVLKKLDELNREYPHLQELGSPYMNVGKPMNHALCDWFRDERMTGVCNHITRNQMQGDLHRYFFAACFAKLHKKSITLKDLPRLLLPEHKNVNEALQSKSMFNDRFRVQLPIKPSTTITSHIAKDGHYYIHPDPIQCRCLSVREAARLQTFPDNYFFCGSRTSQYVQVGNAVPPKLAQQIARIVSKLIVESREILKNHG
ncbi:MAG: DNA (cytosine-5-)-methyltransferase [Dehalococcoidales bacterium]|jgi:DNA (cytosine-5)-methyltransferase 1|nr:DNA (cytosine-5-)-methyltransferase [Dehalococcoidales bacterium]